MKGKTKVLQAIQEYHLNVVIPSAKPLQILQSDKDSIFESTNVQNWMLNEKIRYQASAPYSHNQNGQIERSMGNVMDKARTLMSQSRSPIGYWDYAVKFACHLINQMPTHRNQLTPQEILFSEKLDITGLFPFFSPGVYHRTKPERKTGTWEWKARP